jgi:Tfp pilus assembly protein PilF
VVVAVSPGAAALNDGLSSFQSGEYRRAEVKLAESQKLGLRTPDEQQRAYKTQAFLYCITKRIALCEKAFQSAFSVNSAFDLTRAERGHPVWGPVFAKVQKKQAAR